MPLRPPKLKLKPALIVVLTAVALAGAAYLTLSPQRPVAKVVHPQATGSPQSEVAGASTAPTPTAFPMTTPDDSVVAPAPTTQPTGAAVKPVNTTGPAVATPAPVAQASLTINGVSFNVDVAGVSNVCDLLRAAKTQGKIASLTIYDDPKYMASHGGSAYVYELNGITDQWQYRATDAGGAPLQARGCSLTPVRAGYSVTWFN